MQVNINEFTHTITSTFEARRIISLLYFGSNAFKVNNHKFSDYDFLLLLDKYKKSDLLKLRKILTRNMYKKVDINLNLIYLADLVKRGPRNFQIRSLRPDFYKYLENSIVLIGKNYFKENPIYFSKREMSEYIDFKIQEYYGRCDKLLLQGKSTCELKRKIKKYTKEMLRMLLIRECKLSISEINTKTYKQLYLIAINSKYITRSTALLIKSRRIGDIEKAMRALYVKYLELFDN
ncbi:MAG: hypothetical protein AAB778_03380 [Patescibacteria group bacterium]